MMTVRYRALIVLMLAMMAPLPSRAQPASSLYGQVGKLTVQPRRRDAFIAILLKSTTAMPGCLSYVIAKDAKDGDVIWITELWRDKQSHDASLSLPAVMDAIKEGRPMILKGEGDATIPVGGYGLPTP